MELQNCRIYGEENEVVVALEGANVWGGGGNRRKKMVVVAQVIEDSPDGGCEWKTGLVLGDRELVLCYVDGGTRWPGGHCLDVLEASTVRGGG
ncbi:ADP-ribosylation factor 3 [Actinidia rufa]|uniref:ADP-ribosylation factor 3 n=1 Tax=Actinidia rufa TaxID=165716 RepID=A0A7J0F9H8_9ERIC|nr:ADP-ribosylation factor 3 [Actinidia rufa]